MIIRPRCFRDVRIIDPSAEVLDSKNSFPIAVAPTAFHKMADSEGELSTVKGTNRTLLISNLGAAKAGSILIASSWSTTPIEQMAEEIIRMGGQIWFQARK